MGDLQRAENIYHKILQIDPNQPVALHHLGVAAHQVGKNDIAVDYISKALSIRPGYAEAHKYLGLAFQDLGKQDEAVASYRNAITFKPDFAEAHRLMARIVKHVEYSNDIQAMEKIYATPGIDGREKMHLAFGLGKAFEDLQQYEKAFGFFAEGNKLKGSSCNYSIGDQRNFIDMLKEGFDAALFDRHKGAGCIDETPIFILGMIRSGTSLVEQILASHPRVYGAGEVVLLGQAIVSRFSGQNDLDFAKLVRQADSGVFNELGTEYLKNIRQLSKGAEFTTDKMPENYRYIGIIKLAFPNAKIIHCVRDPVDTCLSIFKILFSHGHEYSYNLEILGEYYNQYRQLMAHWHAVLPGFIHDIRYEDMISDQEGQTRALLEYCGLEWDDACLEFYKTDRQVRTASSEQVRKPIYSDSVQLWKRYGKQLNPLLEALHVDLK